MAAELRSVSSSAGVAKAGPTIPSRPHSKESTDTIYLVLPRTSAVGEDGELSDEELESVADGYPVPTLDLCH